MKNYRTNKWKYEWICVKLLNVIYVLLLLLIFCSLSILSVNDAKTRLKKASRMSLFYLLSYYDTDKSEINIESIFKNCRGIPLCNLYISWIMIHVYDVFFKKSQLFSRQTSRLDAIFICVKGEMNRLVKN